MGVDYECYDDNASLLETAFGQNWGDPFTEQFDVGRKQIKSDGRRSWNDAIIELWHKINSSMVPIPYASFPFGTHNMCTKH